ncbi:MAG: hypothetical protein J1G30_02000 [Spirochaetales bacterium]|nr:hypothetical protein [Spirochaetales bacterium]
MNDIQLFNFNDNQIRIVEYDGMPYFVGKDVALILGYKDTSAALKKHIDNEDKRVGVLPTPKGKQKAIADISKRQGYEENHTTENEEKAKIFFSEVQTFCKERSISINVFLDVICKVFIPELFID